MERVVRPATASALVAALAAALAAPAAMAAPAAGRDMPVGAPAPAPAGFLAYCARQAGDCAQEGPEPTGRLPESPWALRFAIARQSPGATHRPRGAQTIAPGAAAVAAAGATTYAAPFSRDLWRLARRINAQVNRAIVRGDDAAIYGVDDYWAAPLAAGVRVGDCEDYALEKRRALLRAGVPARAVNLALVRTAWGETHAVLLLATDRGEFVLDNLTPWIVAWDQAPYEWLVRQRDGGTYDWALASSPSLTVAAAR